MITRMGVVDGVGTIQVHVMFSRRFKVHLVHHISRVSYVIHPCFPSQPKRDLHGSHFHRHPALRYSILNIYNYSTKENNIEVWKATLLEHHP